VQSLDRQYGLDDEAVKAVRNWRFEPGRKDGIAVPVLVEIEMTFTMRDDSRHPSLTGAEAAPEKGWPPEGVVRIGPDVIAPQVVYRVNAAYTRAAMEKHISGVVVLEAVVGTDGKVTDVRVTRSLDAKYGLDDEAVNTLKEWRFLPGTKHGVAVPVLVEIEMSFAQR
jgi:TonB family protein